MAGESRNLSLFHWDVITERLNDYLKIADAAEFLGVSQNTLRTWGRLGKVKVRVNPANGYRLFRQSDLESFLRKVARLHKAKR